MAYFKRSSVILKSENTNSEISEIINYFSHKFQTIFQVGPKFLHNLKFKRMSFLYKQRKFLSRV
jgi:hypothetical protein